MKSHFFPWVPPLIQTVDVHFLAVKQVFNKLHLIKCRARLPLFWVSWHLQPSSHCQGLACSETHSTSLTSGTEYAHSYDQVLGNMHFSKAHLSTLLSFPMENGDMYPGLWVGRPGSIFPKLQDNRDGNTFELIFGGPQDLGWIGPACLATLTFCYHMFTIELMEASTSAKQGARERDTPTCWHGRG